MLPSIAVITVLFALATASPDDTPPTKANSASYVQSSPAWLAKVKVPKNVVTGYPSDDSIKAGPLPSEPFELNLKDYPEPNKQPPINHPEVQAALKHIDFSKVPKSQPRKIKNWAVDTTTYDSGKDPDCWWSASLCKKPKVDYIPEDVYICPNKGDWGLNYDDGPYKMWWPASEKDKEYDQPRFYNYLVEKKKQKATLFFVGSNVINSPDAAQRALNDGHTICSHTWSHPQMTSLTNEEVVAQLYWTHKAIKETMGITPKCWRPPYGDVDDRVRAIAWQMGMRTFLWDQDSNDWNLLNLKTKVVDGYFEGWIKNRLTNKDTDHGHITLEHENSNVTVMMSEKWLPKLQETFNVMPIHKCLNDPHPYWEESWTYPTLDAPNPPTVAVPSRMGSSASSSSPGSASAEPKMGTKPSSSATSLIAHTLMSLAIISFATITLI